MKKINYEKAIRVLVVVTLLSVTASSIHSIYSIQHLKQAYKLGYEDGRIRGMNDGLDICADNLREKRRLKELANKKHQ